MKLSLRHKSDGKIYPWIAQTTNLMFRVFFRKLYFNRIHEIPTDKPVLLASNHPLAFMDPSLLGTYLDTPLYFMTRGDIFRKPFYRKLMESINMFPVYRMRDGYTNRDRNDEVFDYVAGKLHEKKVVCIFVEGEHHLEMRVRPVQKGVARIAFQAFGQGNLDDLQILPVGCNYQNGIRSRDVVSINVGDPIYVRDYWQMYEQNPALAIRRICELVEMSLVELCYHVQDPADDDLAENLLKLYRSENSPALMPVIAHNTTFFQQEKQLCDAVNNMDFAEKEKLYAKTTTYFDTLKQAGLSDEGLVHPERAEWHWLPLFMLGFIPWLIGKASIWPVVQVSRKVTDGKVKKREYRTSVLMGVGYLVSMVYYPLLALLSLFSANPFVIGLAFLLPVLGWFSLLYDTWWQARQAAVKAQKHPSREQLLAVRKELSAWTNLVPV